MVTPEGYRYGPIGKPELDRWIAEGRITADCRLRSDGSDEWRPADAVYPALRGGGASAGFPGASAGQPSAGMIVAPNPQAGQNPFATQQFAAPANPAATSPYGRATHYQPHRGVVILVLGLMSFVVGCPVLGAIAWFMGSADLREMQAGRMDPEGMGMTQAGRIVGMIHLLLTLVGFGLAMLMFFFMICAGMAGNL
jgi:hypothetical protein